MTSRYGSQELTDLLRLGSESVITSMAGFGLFPLQKSVITSMAGFEMPGSVIASLAGFGGLESVITSMAGFEMPGSVSLTFAGPRCPHPPGDRTPIPAALR